MIPSGLLRFTAFVSLPQRNAKGEVASFAEESGSVVLGLREDSAAESVTAGGVGAVRTAQAFGRWYDCAEAGICEGCRIRIEDGDTWEVLGVVNASSLFRRAEIALARVDR